ncbi:HlyD family efflux transporter periplasmic adaptor subunit [Rhizobium sp. NPDC090279]|uniref:HlyD family efflux transporter periplasmic adaptor subunit n=1 Tax=Rhizobium sp. NPDC090279 TaxID=3364499 RepID=UPI00383A3BBC
MALDQLMAAEDDLKHIDIRAPQDGIVHQLSAQTAGAVVAPDEAIMWIVPDNDALMPELKLSPQDIDQVTIGQDDASFLSVQPAPHAGIERAS